VDGLAVYHRPPSEPHPTDASAMAAPVPPRVVLVHGSMDRGARFHKAARRLRHLDVTRYDRRGYGRSAGAGLADGFGGHADDLLAVLDEQPAVVVGHSFGAVVSLVAAQRRPDLVAAVGAFEPPMPWIRDWPSQPPRGAAQALDGARSPEDAAERFIRSLIGDEMWGKLPPSIRQARRDEGPAFIGEFDSLRRATAPAFDAAAIKVPMLVGLGSDTADRHLLASRRLATAQPGAGPFVIEGAPHGAHTSHPVEFAAYVEAVVARAGQR